MQQIEREVAAHCMRFGEAYHLHRGLIRDCDREEVCVHIWGCSSFFILLPGEMSNGKATSSNLVKLKGGRCGARTLALLAAGKHPDALEVEAHQCISSNIKSNTEAFLPCCRQVRIGRDE